MLSIDNSPALDYCKQGDNTLAAVLAFSFNNASGYTSAPAVGFTGGGGTGAAGTAIVTNGVVTGVTITAPGTGYTSAPTVSFTGGGGTGAAGTAAFSAGGVTGVTITNGGNGQTITVTDNTSYPAGDSRKAVNITAADKFGVKKEFHIGVSPSNVVISLGAAGLNKTEGIDMLATVVSDLGKVKDGSVYGVTEIKTSGNFVMEK